MKFHQRFLKLLRKQNVTDTRSVGRSVVRSFVRSDNVRTVYPPTNTVCGGINMYNHKIRHVSGMIMNYVLFKYFSVKYSFILLFVSSQIIKFGLLI